MTSRLALALGLLLSFGASAQVIVSQTETPRWGALEFKLGGYKPRITAETGEGNPYDQVFGASAMLLGEVEYDRLFWNKFGSLSGGLSAGYAEKYANVLVGESGGTAVTTEVSERTGLKVLPLKLLAVYRFDYAALHWSIPVVPYGKAGLAFTPWWSIKGSGVEFANGERGAGGQWGYAFIGGISIMLDAFDQRLAKDFDSDLGVNHSYLFAEYVYEDVNDFGQGGIDLSSRRWMFGLTLEY